MSSQASLFEQPILYEFPLQEKVRNYLRLEQLSARLKQCCDVQGGDSFHYFTVLFNLLELVERSDCRNDLIKDLERRLAAAEQWQSHPGVDKVALAATVKDIQQLLQALQDSVKATLALKSDKFLASLRQRFSMPGITAYFDLPQLNYWCAQPHTVKVKQRQQWAQAFEPLQQAVMMALKFLRENAELAPLTAVNGLIQGSGEGLILLRIEVPATVSAYPVVSGHKQRYTIRFINADSNANSSSYPHTVECRVATCQDK
ncbi:cell division protein ZapD [Idiomarina tyrosinivorans]|uniref:Cell division protein ZapD n=1 Tax=Idiomarina tyrosinivorans TaxID=1445662 RepID=A0A432ZQF3_9GAMM|nr:cell division protein ZapD [Idiomarina tyrosinivorans]RUO80068.1 cell division protein ZapD [Idiomarina tyrosinivorans]